VDKMPDIDELSIRLTSNSTDASDGLQKLSETLGRVRDATKNGLGLSSVANQVKRLGDSAEGMSTSRISNLKGLADAMQKLSNLGDVKISASIANQITRINTALAGLNIGNGNAKITELVTALQPLETLGKSSLSTTVRALERLPEALQRIDTRQLYTQIQSLTRIFRPLGEVMQQVANGFNAFPSRIQRLIRENDRLNSSNRNLRTSYIDLWAKMRMAYNTIRTGAKIIGGFIKKSTDYTENVNLFNVSMGKYSSEAREYAETVGEAMGIDPGEWMRNKGVFMTLATGFGVASDRANKMSKNLTQLGYDISSLFNMSYEDAMLKLQSGLAGELEPLRRIGYDLSQARLQQEAYTLGITKKISAMTQAEKAELRYHAIMTQVTTSHGDMARTLDAPANQLRVLKSQVEQAGRAIGNIFIPILQAVLPYCIAFVKAIRLVANELARLVGFKEYTADLSGMDSLASGADDYATALGGAADNAKKLQKYTMGFDELNVIDPNQGKSGSSGGVGGTGFDFELPEYNFLGEGTQTKVDGLVTTIKDNFATILGLVTGIGTGLLAWKFSKSFLTGLSVFSSVLGLGILIDSIRVTFKDGLSWKSAIEGAIGGALIGAGIGFKLGGVPGAIGGAIIGIGISLVINGITAMLADGVQTEDVVAIITGVLTTVGGIIGTIKWFNNRHTSPLPDLDTAGQTIADTNTGTSQLTLKLKTLATNLALGAVIIAEVAIIAATFVGAVWLIGWELENVGKAWQPVIDNAGTVAIAMGIGTALLVAIGTASYYLGSVGKTMIVNLALGTATLTLLGVNTGLFLAEIWLMGELLDEIGIAWQPVLDNGETIAKAIGIGTGLLVAIGVVTAALGMATVASVGLLPVAIALGTALLVEMSVAFTKFCDSLIDVADKLSKDLHPAVNDLNDILPDLNTDLESFINFMGTFAELTVEYTKNNAISGFASTVDSIIGFFTKDPIKALANDVEKQYKHSVSLNSKLSFANPELETAIREMTVYKTRIDDLRGVVNSINVSELSIQAFVNLVTIGGEIEKFGKKLRAYYDEIKHISVQTMDNMVSCLNDIIDFAVRLQSEVDTNAIDNFTEAIKRLTRAIDNLPTSKTVTIRAVYESSGSAPEQFATGGFPETGQMFIAREAGAELVGNIGRKTAVVNNEQIVASVSRGVAEANSEQNSLLREQNTLLRALLEKESGVYLDGKRITNSVEKHQRERGRTVLVGGAL
jgi:hypothetical protein